MGGTVKLCLAVDKTEKFHPWPADKNRKIP
jgi:hypothetical protein